MPRPSHQHSAIESAIRVIDRATMLSGHAIAWLLLLLVLLESAVVLLRYGFDLGSIALQETVTYVHAAAFLLGAAYTLQCDKHVRVDIFYRRFSEHRKACINLFGFAVFLLPVCLFIIWQSAPYVAQAWQIREASADSGGLARVYWLKTLIPLFSALLIVQGTAEALRAWLVLKGTTVLPQAARDDRKATL